MLDSATVTPPPHPLSTTTASRATGNTSHRTKAILTHGGTNCTVFGPDKRFYLDGDRTTFDATVCSTTGVTDAPGTRP
jgi:hypothetical protein